jgi:hypothetical protein
MDIPAPGDLIPAARKNKEVKTRWKISPQQSGENTRWFERI